MMKQIQIKKYVNKILGIKIHLFWQRIDIKLIKLKMSK